uniref:Zinc finger RANBP2-type containing 3 n=1 Tax=Rousettus aegyptiacus TaxID=9407 RepID=A0A7J8JP14_ROUAE|nr:zinc finger RANBP2-type containing 3 [Rousettus aegyptiacus]
MVGRSNFRLRKVIRKNGISCSLLRLGVQEEVPKSSGMKFCSLILKKKNSMIFDHSFYQNLRKVNW